MDGGREGTSKKAGECQARSLDAALHKPSRRIGMPIVESG